MSAGPERKDYMDDSHDNQSSIDPNQLDQAKLEPSRRDAVKGILATLVVASIGSSRHAESASRVVEDDTIDVTDANMSEIEQLFKENTLKMPRGNDIEPLIYRHIGRYKGTGILSSLDEKEGALHTSLMRGWRRMAESGDLKIIKQSCDKYKVPFDLAVSLGLLESHWTKNAISKSGALGPWQLMPGTANDLGLSRSDCFDVEKSTDAAMKYIRFLYEETKKWEHYLNHERSYNPSPEQRESDRWMWALTSYHRGYGDVMPDYIGVEGDPSQYPRVHHGHYSRNYVPTFWGIRTTLASIHNINPQLLTVFEIETGDDAVAVKPTLGDELYNNYINAKKGYNHDIIDLTLEEKLIRLSTLLSVLNSCEAAYRDGFPNHLTTPARIVGMRDLIGIEKRNIRDEMKAANDKLTTRDQEKTLADTRYEDALRHYDTNSPVERLTRFQEVMYRYTLDKQSEDHSPEYIDARIAQIEEHIYRELLEHPEDFSFRFERKTEHGFAFRIKEEEGVLQPYKLRTGNGSLEPIPVVTTTSTSKTSLESIANDYCSHPDLNKRFMQLVKRLNPHFNFDNPKAGVELRIPDLYKGQTYYQIRAEKGDLKAYRVNYATKVERPILLSDYSIPDNNFDMRSLAVALSPNPGDYDEVEELIKAINPGINLKTVIQGMIIRIPAVPYTMEKDKSLLDVARQYYPGYTDHKTALEQAVLHIKRINGNAITTGTLLKLPSLPEEPR